MSDAGPSDPQQLMWDDRKRLDLLCDRFESAWLAGERPSLSHFVGEAYDSDDLFSELLGLEIVYRRRLGESPSPQDYTPQFPERDSLIAAVFSAQQLAKRETSADSRDAHSTVFDTVDAVAQELRPQLNDEFELLEALGRGGMGVVFKARHRTMQRLVAIKVPRPGRFTSTEERERFEREARLVAQLDHPGIVRVHDVGRTATCTYMVSEFVKGQTLAEAIQEGSFSIRESAKLISVVAAALHHAHSRGVVHRDLKTSNIILENNSPAQPKLMDFGLALKLDDEETVTQAGDVLGTPAYMSPEQARGDAHGVDGRGDVYSLGVILYELLAGERPFRGTSRQLIRQVLEDDPRPPRQLNDTVPLDLETIALKCLSKEPAHRYQSAAEVADELQRHLAGIPILARPVSAWRRRWLWCRRNPAITSLSAIAIASLFAVAVISTVAYVQTSRSLKETQQAREQADQFFKLGNQAVEDLFTTVSEDTLLNQPGMQPLRQTLLYRAREYYEQFLAHRGEVTELQAEMGLALFRVGRIDEELKSPEQALVAYRQARELQSKLLTERPDNAARKEALSDTLTAMGRCAHRIGDFTEADEAYQEAFHLRQSIAQRTSNSVEDRRKLASIIMNRGLLAKDSGEWETAKGLMAQAQSIRREIFSEDDISGLVRRDLAMGYFNLAALGYDQLASTDTEDVLRQLQEVAESNVREAIQRFDELVRSNPADLDNRQRQVLCEQLLGNLLCVVDRREEATSQYASAYDRIAELARNNPSVLEFRINFARVAISKAENLLHQRQVQPALEAFTESIGHLDAIIEANVALADVRRDYVKTRQMMAATLYESSRREEAVAELEQLLTRLSDFERRLPDDVEIPLQINQTEGALQLFHSAPDMRSNL